MQVRLSLVAMALGAALATGCSSDGSGGSNNGGDGPGSDLGVKLKPIDNSATFYAELRGALLQQSRGGGAGGFGGPEVIALESQAPATPTAAPGASADTAGGAGAQTSESRNEVTSTNVQEAGVDEQDRMKLSSDGNRLYVLSSGFDFATPVPLDGGAVPPSDELAFTSMPVPDQYTTRLRIMGLDDNAYDATELGEVSVDLAGRYADGFYLYENNGVDSAIVTSSGGGYWANWGNSYGFSGLTSLVSRVDVSNPQTAGVTGSLEIDGQIVSSRRIGKHFFFASRYYPYFPEILPGTLSPEELEQRLDDTDLATLLPAYRDQVTDVREPLIQPAGCFVAPKPADTLWYSPDIITLGVIDLDTMQLTDSECYLGSTETLYASPDAVYLATTQWDYSFGPVDVAGNLVDVDDAALTSDAIWVDPRTTTDIHQFDIDGGQLVYNGSGSVKGHLGWNELRKPFRMSEKDGFLRVATINDQQTRDNSPIFLSILEPDGRGNLNRIAQLPNDAHPEPIGKPGEQLYASRFLGDRAYLVTFRQTDPLYVIDMGNPTDPRIAGELEIEGYSDYLEPIGRNHLLGIGKDAVATGDAGDGRGALVQGVKLALFNVENPREPFEVQSLVIGQRGTDATALTNHRAINIQRETEEHPTRISFGIDVHGRADAGTDYSSPRTWYPWSYTGLHGFDVRGGDDAGITPRGALVVETADSSAVRYGPQQYGDRSVMVNNTVFYVHGDDVWGARWDDLGTANGPR